MYLKAILRTILFTLSLGFCKPSRMNFLQSLLCLHKSFIIGRGGELQFSLTYVGKNKHRLLIDVQYTMTDMVAGCLLCQLSPIVMSKYMNNFNATQGKSCI